jgi:hypothetical protein
LGFEIDELVYRIECVVDQGRTTQFEEPHTAEGGFESIKCSTIVAIIQEADPRLFWIACMLSVTRGLIYCTE